MPDSLDCPAPQPPLPPVGLPLIATAPLSAAERTALRDLARALRVTADSVDDALASNRVTHALDACIQAGELGTAAARAAAVIGSGR